MHAENRRRRRRRVWAQVSYSRIGRAAPCAGPGVTGKTAEMGEGGAMDWESALLDAGASSPEEVLWSHLSEKDVRW